MFHFRRAVRLLFLLLGVVAGMCSVLAAYVARMLVRPPRQGLWTTPASVGLACEDVQFPARDSLRLSGWFIPSVGLKVGQRAATLPVTLILVHGWPWNRLGTSASNILSDIPGSRPVDLLHLARDLHHVGYQVLMIDLRNHGRSASAGPYTFGLLESSDVLGAIDFLNSRRDVDNQRIGLVGFGAGANAVLFALPRAEQVLAAVAVQPASPSIWMSRFTTSFMGPLGRITLTLTELLYRLGGGLKLTAMEPLFAAAGVGDTPVLYVQGRRDPWGSPENVAQMAAQTPNAAGPLFVDTAGHYAAYQYILDNPAVIDTFIRAQVQG